MAIIDFNSYVGFDKCWYDGSGIMATIHQSGSYYYTQYYWSSTQIPGWTDANGYIHGYDAARGSAGNDIYKSVFVAADRKTIGVSNHVTGNLAYTTVPGLSNIARPSYAAGKIIFHARNTQTGRDDIWVLYEDGTYLYPLSSALNGVQPGSISPDGTLCAFAANSPNNGRQIYTVNTSGYGIPFLLPPNTDPNYPESDMPAFSPDGTKLVYVGGVLSTINRWDPSTWVRFGIWSCPVYGYSRTLITVAQPGAGNKIDNPAWWPAVAGSGIVYDYYEPTNTYTGFWCTDGAGNYEWLNNLLPHGWSANPCYQCAT
jgi:Tol biopolymer transport system component